MIDQVPASGPQGLAESDVCVSETQRDLSASTSCTPNPNTNADLAPSPTHPDNLHLFDSAPDGVLVARFSHDVQFTNRALATMFKLSDRPIDKEWPRALLSEACAQLVESELRTAAICNGSPPKLFGDGRSLIACRSDATRFPVHVTCRMILQGDEPLVVCFVRDISLQVEVEDEFQRQNARLKATIDCSPIGICMITRSFALLETNRAFANMIGYPVQDVIGKKFTTLAHPDDAAKIERAACQNFLEQRDHYTLHCRFNHKQGHAIHAAMTIGLIRDALGNPEHAIVNVQDLTQRRAAQRQMKAQQSQLNHLERLSVLGEMSAGIAHEIDQPLTAISNYAQSAIRFISSSNLKPERAAAALRHLSQEAQRAGNVVQKVRDLARRRPGQNTLIDCSALIDEVEELIRFNARSHQVNIRTVLSRRLPNVLGDSIQIQQVVLNLVRNALDASQEASTKSTPEITLRTETSDDGGVLVAVSDQGEGVDDAIASHLFEPFSTTKKTGIGLGLSISQSIVAAHGGQLAFEINPSDGTTFYFTLPRAPEH